MPLLPALIVPLAVKIEIELLFTWGTVVPWFCAKIPLAPGPELMVTPLNVVTFTEPSVEIATIPVEVVPVIVAELPTSILSEPVPLVWALIPMLLPETLP